MKKLLSFIVIFALGALSFFLISTYLSRTEEAHLPVAVPTSTPSALQDTPAVQASTTPDIAETIVIAPDGSQLDGPFPVYDADDTETTASVRFVRSPEENLIQFEDFDGSHSFASHVYLADDMRATHYLNLGPAQLQEGVLVYGIPLDASLDEFSYILVYDTQLDEVEYYAKVR